MLGRVAPVMLAGMASALSSALFAGRLGNTLLIAGCAMIIPCCAVMAAACGWDAVDEWRREHERNRT
jgi:hypothetical protein